jgi:hypothetical protein
MTIHLYTEINTYFSVVNAKYEEKKVCRTIGSSKKMANKSVVTLKRQLLFTLTMTSVFLSKRCVCTVTCFCTLIYFFCLKLCKIYVCFAILGSALGGHVKLVIEFVLLYTEEIITCNNPTLKYICMCKIRISLIKHMTLGIADHRPNEADAAGIGILASGISGCVMRDFILPPWVSGL